MVEVCAGTKKNQGRFWTTINGVQTDIESPRVCAWVDSKPQYKLTVNTLIYGKKEGDTHYRDGAVVARDRKKCRLMRKVMKLELLTLVSTNLGGHTMVRFGKDSDPVWVKRTDVVKRDLLLAENGMVFSVCHL